MLQYGLAVLVLCSSALLESHHKSGKTQKVIYPNGRIVYEPIPTKQAPKPAKPAPAPKVVDAPKAPTPSTSPPPVDLSPGPMPTNPPLPCAGCPTGPDPHTGQQCKEDNPVVITTSGGPGCTGERKCEERKNPEVGKLDEVPGQHYSFYANCKEYRAETPIPVYVRNEREEYLFGKAQYGEPCCRYEVCVVTHCCCIDTKECELRPKDVAMRACRRRADNTIDVYVLNEPGFPVQWVLHLGLNDATYAAKFPGKPVP